MSPAPISSERIGQPIISTSVNSSGLDPARTWAEAKDLVEKNDVFHIPDIDNISVNEQSQSSSTIIAIQENNYKILRHGSLKDEVIYASLQRANRPS